MRPTVILLALLMAGPLAAIEPIDHPDPEQFTAGVKTRLSQARERFEAARRAGELDGEDYGELAMTYDANDVPAAAGQAYRNAAEVAPYDARWPYYLGQLAYRQGDFARAEKSLRKSLELNPDYKPAYVRLGVTLIEQGKLDAAIGILGPLVSRNPDIAVARAELGRALLQTGDFQGALDHLQAAQARQPQATRLYHQIGQALRGLGRNEEAREALSRAGDAELALRDPLYEAMQQRSGSANYWNNLAHRTLATGDVEGALRLMRTAVSADPDNVYSTATLAMTLARTQRFDAALALLEAFDGRNPENPIAAFAWGLILAFREDDAAAIQRFKVAYTANPDMADALLQAAHASMRLKRFSEAEALYARVQGLAPNDVSLALLRAAAQYAGGDCRKAMDTLVLSVPLAPENPDLLRTYARVAAGCDRSTAEERENALNAARNLHQISPDLYTTDTLAVVEASHGRFKEAESILLEALFHVSRNGQERAAELLQTRLGQVRDQTIVDRPWPPGHPLMWPPRPDLTSDGKPAGPS